MSRYSGCASYSFDDQDAMIRHYASMYPPIAHECYPHVVSAVDEMDDPRCAMIPPEMFEAMTDRIMSRVEDAQLTQVMPIGFDRRRNLLRALIISVLIAELLRRRRRRFI